jgi:hypothetical protein
MTLAELKECIDGGCDVRRIGDNSVKYYKDGDKFVQVSMLPGAVEKPYQITYEDAIATDWVVVKVASITTELHQIITCCAEAAYVNEGDIRGYEWSGTWFYVLDDNGDTLFKFQTWHFPKDYMGKFPINYRLYKEQVWTE